MNYSKRRCPSCGELVASHPLPPDPEGLAKVAESHREHNDRVEAAQRVRESSQRLQAAHGKRRYNG